MSDLEITLRGQVRQVEREAAAKELYLNHQIQQLEERIENATMAASETQPTWKHRCYEIMSALGFDYGDLNWVMPDERSALETKTREAFEGGWAARDEVPKHGRLTYDENQGEQFYTEWSKKP